MKSLLKFAYSGILMSLNIFLSINHLYLHLYELCAHIIYTFPLGVIFKIWKFLRQEPNVDISLLTYDNCFDFLFLLSSKNSAKKYHSLCMFISVVDHLCNVFSKTIRQCLFSISIIMLFEKVMVLSEQAQLTDSCTLHERLLLCSVVGRCLENEMCPLVVG